MKIDQFNAIAYFDFERTAKSSVLSTNSNRVDMVPYFHLETEIHSVTEFAGE